MYELSAARKTKWTCLRLQSSPAILNMQCYFDRDEICAYYRALGDSESLPTTQLNVSAELFPAEL